MHNFVGNEDLLRRRGVAIGLLLVRLENRGVRLEEEALQCEAARAFDNTVVPNEGALSVFTDLTRHKRAKRT